MECIGLIVVIGAACLAGYILYKVEDWWSSR